MQYPSAQSKRTSEILGIYRGSQFMYFNEKTVHTCTNSLGRGLKDYVGCHCKGKHCHCHLVGCYRHCHSVGCHYKKKHFHQVGCNYSTFGWVSSLSGGGVIVPVGSLVCSTCSLSSHITMLKAHKKVLAHLKCIGRALQQNYNPTRFCFDSVNIILTD